ncbi:MAG: hypothetical protein ABJA84_03870 [Polaromonas sp.]
MRFAIKFLLWSCLSCAITVSLLWSLPAASANLVAASNVQQQAPTIAVEKSAVGGKDETSNKAGEFIDMARLVLESSRDQTATTTAFIERATTVIVVFFTLLGVGGALLGWSKLRDMEASANSAIKQFNTDLEQLRDGASGLSAEFSQMIESSMGGVRAEMLARIELLAASAEIAHAKNGNESAQQKMQLLSTAAKRLDAVVKRPELSPETRIRGLADLGYAKKRLGDVDSAFSVVQEAATLAKHHAPDMYPLLAYNAACYSAILGRTEASDWLSRAINENAEYRDNACADEDFLKVRDFEWFKKLTAK